MCCALLDGMLFRAEFCGLGHARAGKLCGNMTLQDGAVPLWGAILIDLQTGLRIPARVWRCVVW